MNVSTMVATSVSVKKRKIRLAIIFFLPLQRIHMNFVLNIGVRIVVTLRCGQCASWFVEEWSQVQAYKAPTVMKHLLERLLGYLQFESLVDFTGKSVPR